MAVDQVELLTRERSRREEPHAAEASHILETLPVKESTESVRDRMINDTEAEEPRSLFERAVLSTLNIVMIVSVAGALLIAAWAVLSN